MPQPDRPPRDDDWIAELSEFVEAKGAGGKGRRSPLARWLIRNREGFARLLAEKDPAWETLADGLAAKGLRDGTGKPPSGERLRKTWWEVNRQPTRRKQPPSPLPSPPPAPPDTPVTTDPVNNPFGFKPGKPK